MEFHNQEIELMTLQNMAMRYEETEWAIDKLTVNDFYTEETKLAFGEIKKAHSKNRKVDIIELMDVFKKSEYNQDFYLDIMDIPIQHTSKLNIRTLKELSVKRILSQTMVEAKAMMEKDLDGAIRKLSALTQIADNMNSDEIKMKHISEFGTVELELFDKRISDNALLGEPSGYRRFDQYMDGLSDYIVIGGRPSMGKTALALNLANGFMESTRKGVAFFSLETRDRNIADRFFTIDGEMNQKGTAAFIKSQIKENPLMATSIASKSIEKLKNVIQKTSKKGFWINDDYDLTIESIRLNIKSILKNKERFGDIGMVMIDYVQICESEQKFNSSREKVNHVSRMVKMMVKEFGIPIVLLAQIGRSAEASRTKEPTMSDLKESGAIEQDADKIILLHRPGYYSRDADDNSTKVIIAKNKDGATGVIPFTFNPKILKFEEVVPIDRRTD